jgi:citrate synthase
LPRLVASPLAVADSTIARVLGLEVQSLRDELSYQSIPQWDSLRHVMLMLALEEALSVNIDDRLTASLSTVRSIRTFAMGAGRTSISSGITAGNEDGPSQDPGPTLHRGLEGLYFDKSSITHIDGSRGTLEYRGYPIGELVQYSTFEETAYLLIYGDLPDPDSLSKFSAELSNARKVPDAVIELVRGLAHTHPMVALRTGISALSAFQDDPMGESVASIRHAGIRLIAQVPMLIAAHHAARQGRELVNPPPGSSHAAYFLLLLRGKEASQSEITSVDRDLILHSDHSSNASTFVARVVIGCHADIYAAVTAAVSAFAGTVHGGAAENTLKVIDEVGTPDCAHAYVTERRARNESIAGFGHRVYRTEDPRVRHLREMARQMSYETGNFNDYRVVQALAEAMRPWSRHGVDANVDLYAGLVYRMLGLEDDLAVPIFVAGRIAGWVAQILEQNNNNVLIRPLLHYIGHPRRLHPRGVRPAKPAR